MKKLMLLAALMFSAFSMNAQITKADVEAMLSANGTTMAQIEEVWVGNRMAFYTDGTSKRTDAKYTTSKGNKFVLTDTGIRADWSKDGDSSSILWPFSSMQYISVSKDGISIHLRN